MDAEAFLGSLIRFVVALGVVSAAFTVGEDVLAPEENGVHVASGGGPAGPADALADATKAVNSTPPANRSAEPDSATRCSSALCGDLLA